MDEDDEFSFDDIDDELMSAMAAIEQSYYASTQKVPKKENPEPVQPPKPPTPAGPPPSKKPRTETWAPPQKPATSKPVSKPVFKKPAYDMDDAPDISISVDGSYVVTQQPKPKSNAKPASTTTSNYPPPKPPDTHPKSLSQAKPPPQNGFKPPANGRAITPGLASSTASSSTTATPRSNTPLLSSSANGRFVPPNHRSSSPALVSSSQKPGPPPPRTKQAGQPTRQSFAPQVPTATPGAGPSKPPSNGHVPPAQHQPALSAGGVPDDVALLKAQLAQLQQETELLKVSLTQAHEAKLMKDGEASNIKRAMDKQNKDHAEAIERLKAERDAKIAAATKSQDTLQSTIEALKAQLTFQKHEMEFSSSKWNLGSAKKKQSSQFGGPSQTPRRTDAWAAATPLRRTATPVRSLASQLRGPSPVKSAVKPVKRSENKPVKEEPQFAMFHNSFAKGSSPVKKRDKGKGKDVMSSPTKMDVDESQPQSQASPVRPFAGDEAQMGGNNASQYEDFEPDEHPPEPWRIDWRRELHTLLFSHSIPDFDSRPVAEPELTLQILLSTVLPTDAPITATASYRHGCALILGAFGIHPRDEDWVSIVRDVAKGLVVCVEVLVSLKLLQTLIPVLKLIDSLLVLIPPFAAELLAPSLEDDPKASAFASTLADLVRDNLAPPIMNAKDKRTERPPEPWAKIKTSFAISLIDVAESLAWSADLNNIARLAPFVRRPDALMHLLDTNQPSWVVTRALKMLVAISMHSTLFLPLMGLPLKDGAAVEHKDFEKIPLVQKLCAYLVTPHKWATPPEVDTMFESILAFFATISEVHEQGISALIESIWAIPSLIALLMRTSAPMFEDDEALLSSSEEAQLRVVERLHSVLHLLWHVVKPWEPTVDLRTKILQAAARDPQQFNGLHHLFIVTLGRLSFADPPDWLPQPGKDALVKMSEFARDVLDVVVEGPESDAIWEAYQAGDEEDETGPDADEEELAMQMGMQVDQDG